jgi:lipid II:glycine glycyltransferase (peptidoglycan interpeptide bridge formation enzyme)
MASQKITALRGGYSWEADTLDERAWGELLQEFEDANIYQSWPFAAVTSGHRSMSHVLLRKDGEIVAAALARTAKVPWLPAGIAYIRWGPVWRRTAKEANPEDFRQMVRALRNEYACKRGLVLRLFPFINDQDPPEFSSILAEEGFASLAKESRSRTILMDLKPSLQELREGLSGNWKRNLKQAERNALEVVEGTQKELFAQFIAIYKEMVARKKFSEPNDINQFKLIQSQLLEKHKMRILLGREGNDICCGAICSAMGNTAIYLFGATSESGLKKSGSYLLQWKLLEHLKQSGITIYNLHGINPLTNPGTYKFKSDLAGKHGQDVFLLGRFDAHASSFSSSCVQWGEALRATYRSLKGRTRNMRGLKLRPKTAN